MRRMATEAWTVIACLLLASNSYSYGQRSTPPPQRTLEFEGQMGGMVATSDGRYLYISDKLNALVLKLDLCSFDSQQVTVPSQPGSLALSPDESTLYVAKSGATSMAVVDTSTWTVQTTWDLAGNVPYDIEATDSRIYIAANTSHDAALVIVDAANGRIIDVHEDNWDSNTRLIEVDRTRNKLYSAVVDWSPSNLCRWNIDSDAVSQETKCDHGALGSNGQNLTLSPDGTHILFMVGGGNGAGYTVYNLQALSEKFQSRDGEYDIGTYPLDMVYHPNGERAYGICGDPYDKAITILNTETQVREGTIEPYYQGSEDPVKLCISGDGGMLILYAENSSAFLDVFTLENTCPTPPPTPSPTPFQLVLEKCDYNGDGTSDVAIFRRSSGMWSVRSVTRVFFGSASDSLVPGDYDGGGTTDIAIFRPGSGLWSVRKLSRFYLGNSYDVPVPGDYNGDGTSEAGLFRDLSGLWAIRDVTRLYFGLPGDTAIPGDYDGQGGVEIAVFRRGSGSWSVLNLTRFYFGFASDELVPGDYDGDGTWEGGIFRPSTGLWSIRNVTRFYLGNSSDWSLPADYNGNGGDEGGIFRGGAGLWAVRNLTRIYFGSTGDVPATR